MNRRGFLKAMFAGAAVVVAAPVVAAASKVMPKPVGLPEINLVIDSSDIVNKNRKLKAIWSMESQQDLRACHNLDAERELTEILAREIQAEIDKEVLADLRSQAGYFYTPYVPLTLSQVC